MEKNVVLYLDGDSEDIYRKYGSGAFSIPREFWGKFEELVAIYKTFHVLYHKHFEDLKCYALMYYDIDLYQKEIDLDYIAFFVQKEKEIIGYKNHIFNDTSIKSRVVQLYYNYEPILSLCIHTRTSGFRLNRKIRKGTNFSYETYVKIKEKDFPIVRGVHQLTEEECKVIIDNQSDIVNNHRIYGNVKTFPSVNVLNSRNGIIENFIIPCFFSSEWAFRRKCIIEYINTVFNVEILSYVNLHKRKIEKALSIKLKNVFNYSDENIKRLEESKPQCIMIKSYEERFPFASLSHFDSQILFDSEILSLRALQSCSKTKEEAWEISGKIVKREREIRDRQNEIKKNNKEILEKENIKIREENSKRLEIIKEIDAQICKIRQEKRIELTKEYNAIMKDLEEEIFKIDIWQSIIDNQKEIESYISQKYDENIKAFWLKYPDDCRAYLQVKRNYDNLVETFIELYCCPLNPEIRKKSHPQCP